MMRLNIAPAPWPGAPVVVLSAGLGGGGGYWLAQRAALEEQYQLVSYDHNGTGENAGPLPAGYSLATMAGELFSALQAAGIARFALVGHALGALIGLQLALDRPEAVSALALVNGWLSLSPHTRRCFQVRERLLHAGGAQAWVERSRYFLPGGMDGRAPAAPRSGRCACHQPFSGQRESAEAATGPEAG